MRVEERVEKQRKKKIARFFFVLFIAAGDVLDADFAANMVRTEGSNYYKKGD